MGIYNSNRASFGFRRSLKRKLEAADLLVHAMIFVLLSIGSVLAGLHIRFNGKEKLTALNNGERTIETTISEMVGDTGQYTELKLSSLASI